MKNKKGNIMKTGLITAIAGSQLFTLAPVTAWAEENKTVEEGKETENQDQWKPATGSVEENKTVEERKETENQDQLKPATSSVEENNTTEYNEERGVNWIYKGEIKKNEKVPFNQNTRQDGKLNLQYVANVDLGTQLFERSNILIRIPDTFKNIIKQAGEKGIDFRKYISASVEYPDPLGSGIFYKTKKYDWHEIEFKYGDTLVLQVPKSSFLVMARFTTDITFNYGDLIRDADIVPNKGNYDEMDMTWTTNIIDWTVIGDKKTHVDVNPLVIGNAIEKPTINAEDKVINVGDKFDPLEGVSATDGEGNPLKVVVESNTVDSKKPGSYKVKYSATDKYGNKAEKTITVTVTAKDPTEKPTIYAENKTINVGDEFDPKKDVYAIDSEGHVLDVNVVANTVDTNTSGNYIVIYSATDKYGNKAEKHITVTVKAKDPTEKPTIYAENKTINVGDEFDPKKDVYAIDSEGRILQVEVEANTVDTKQPGSYIVVYSATDRYGNKAKEVITVTVKAKDPTEKPTIYAENKTINVGDEFDPKKDVYAVDVEGHVIDVNVVANTVDTNTPGSYIVVYSATDKYGNKAEKAITVTVKAPTEKPTINAEDKTIQVGDKFDPLEGVSATDGEGNPLEVVVESNTVNPNEPGSYKVKYSATDKYGNKAEKTITVTVKAPTEKPTINAEDKTIQVGDKFDPLEGVSATDGEGNPLEVVVESNTVNPNEPGSYKVKYSATDKYGNKAEKTITVTVKAPTEKPTINAEDKTIQVGDKFDPLEGVSATDGEGNPLEVVVESNTVNSNEPGSYKVKYSATDKYGNKAEKTITVTVKAPTEKPTINAEDKTIQVGDKFDPLEGVSATDGEGNPLEVVVESNTVNPNEPGSYKVKYSATDKYGNKAEKTITVTVNENKDYSISVNDFNIDSDTYLTGKVGKDVAKIQIEINGTVVNIVEPTMDGSYRAYIRNYITSVNDVVKVISLDKDGRRKETAIAKLIYNNVILSAEDYTIGEDKVVKGIVDKRATKVILYDTDENTALRQGKINNDGTYEISAVDIITSKNKNYAVVAFEGNTELKRVTVNLKESNNEYILTANDYTIGESYIEGTYDPTATKVVLYVDGVPVKNSSLNSTDYTYRVAAKSYVTNKNQKVEVVASRGTQELKRVTVNVKESESPDYVLTANDYTIGEEYIEGTYDLAATKVVLYVDGVAVKNSSLNSTDYTYKVAAKSYVTNKNQKVEVVASRGTQELKRVKVNIK